MQSPACDISSLVAAVFKAGLVETLSGAGPYTVFAPTDAAFEQLFQDLQVSGIESIPADDLVPILQYHVVSGNILSTDLTAGEVPTLNGNISISMTGGVTINGNSAVIATDVQGSNGEAQGGIKIFIKIYIILYTCMKKHYICIK